MACLCEAGSLPSPEAGPRGGERLAVGQLPGLQVLSAACSMLGAGHLPGCGCCSGKGDVIHQGDKAADERWASEQLFLSSSWNGCWRRGREGKRGKAHSEIKNDGPAGGGDGRAHFHQRLGASTYYTQGLPHRHPCLTSHTCAFVTLTVVQVRWLSYQITQQEISTWWGAQFSESNDLGPGSLTALAGRQP